MKFLHTADWHLGRTMRGKSRASEHEAVLAELVEIAKVEQVDAMLVCGDIWDTASPSPESDRLLNEALREFIGLGVDVVLIAGNRHDWQLAESAHDLNGVLSLVSRDDGSGICGEQIRATKNLWGLHHDRIGNGSQEIAFNQHVLRCKNWHRATAPLGHLEQFLDEGLINKWTCPVVDADQVCIVSDGGESGHLAERPRGTAGYDLDVEVELPKGLDEVRSCD